jgi:sialate O-acetylesterase
MIDSWRFEFARASQSDRGPFPFGFVQLNSVGRPNAFTAADVSPAYAHPLQLGDSFAGLRWAQSGGYGYAPNPRLVNTFMAVVLDTPQASNTGMGPYSVHSIFKQPTGARLAAGALATVYGGPPQHTGPIPTAASIDAHGSVAVIFGGFSTGFEVRQRAGFEVYTSDLGWRNATIGSTVVHPVGDAGGPTATIRLAGVHPNTSMIRYLWRSNPCPLLNCSIYSDGSFYKLPAAPFWTTVAGAVQ